MLYNHSNPPACPYHLVQVELARTHSLIGKAASHHRLIDSNHRCLSREELTLPVCTDVWAEKKKHNKPPR